MSVCLRIQDPQRPTSWWDSDQNLLHCGRIATHKWELGDHRIFASFMAVTHTSCPTSPRISTVSFEHWGISSMQAKPGWRKQPLSVYWVMDAIVAMKKLSETSAGFGCIYVMATDHLPNQGKCRLQNMLIRIVWIMLFQNNCFVHEAGYIMIESLLKVVGEGTTMIRIIEVLVKPWDAPESIQKYTFQNCHLSKRAPKTIGD